jgi:hypothetical protein
VIEQLASSFLRPADCGVPVTTISSNVLVVCIRCIEMDALTGTKPFLRLEWRQAWRTNCSIHGVRLLRTTLNFMAEGVHTVNGARECQRLRSHRRLSRARRSADSTGISPLGGRDGLNLLQVRF